MFTVIATWDAGVYFVGTNFARPVVEVDLKKRDEGVVIKEPHVYGVQTGVASQSINEVQTTGMQWIEATEVQYIQDWTSEWSGAEIAELRRRYKDAQDHPPTAEFLRNAPDLLDPDFG